MKKLLAGEMSKENESRRPSPSVIARLMGLDGLPLKQPHHNLRKRTESSRTKVQKSGMFYRRSSRKRSEDEQGFKDVSEVLDASEVETGGYLWKGTANSKLSDVEVDCVQHKFMEAKGVSTDEKLKDSEEFGHTVEVLASNKDILLRFLQKPDSLFAKHFDDLQGATSQSRCGRISAMKSSHTLKNQNDCLGQRAGRETQLKHHSKSPQQLQEDTLSRSCGRCAAHGRLKVPKVRLEENIVPTTIVVLKPNLGMSHYSTSTDSLPCYSHHYPSGCQKNVHQDIGFSRPNRREITRQMKNRFSNGSIKISTSRFRGYSGDVWGSKSENDSDVTTVSYTDRRLLSLSSESSLSREAKKRLSERWKLTHRPQEIDSISSRSTLGEMLAISDSEVSRANSSSTYCWKDGCVGNFSNHGSPGIYTGHDNLCRDKYAIRKDGSKSGRDKAVKLNLNQLEAPWPNDQRFRVEKSRFPISNCSSNEELSAPTSLNSVVSTGDLDNSDNQEPSEGPSKQATLHCPVPEQESRVICKEADQCSPVSIIEAPFTEEFSSGSECFESISTDLHGLRMQLQLLKLESEAYEEGSMLLSSDEASVGFAEYQRIPRDENNWESMYIVDILVDSGINGIDPNTFLGTWHSPECPVNPLIFEELEKKHRILNPCSRVERRLVFDMINSKLLEIYEQYMDQLLHPSVKSAGKLVWKWNMEELEQCLRKSLVRQNMELQMDVGVVVLAGECQWLESREDIEVICREIERLLVDELAAEVMAV